MFQKMHPYTSRGADIPVLLIVSKVKQNFRAGQARETCSFLCDVHHLNGFGVYPLVHICHSLRWLDLGYIMVCGTYESGKVETKSHPVKRRIGDPNEDVVGILMRRSGPSSRCSESS